MNRNSAVKILLVEDDKVTFRAVQRSLEKHGFLCYGAGTLAEAVTIIKHEALDLVLCDLMLPDGNGMELLEIVRMFLMDIPFVVITASEKKSLIRDAMRMGANDFLTKPFNLDNLPTVIERNLIREKLNGAHGRPRKVSVLIKTIQALIAALEAKDSYTSGHSMRVARHARLIGNALKLSDDEQFTLELSALLHDIGKIGMPDRILNKTSSLEDMEYKTAKEHPVVGSNIVGKIDELQGVSAIIRHHHERFDGTGYPDGLSGQAIPLFARILAIVDAYESIVSKRTYRKPKTSEEALSELEKNAGTQFDPELTALFIKLLHTKNTNLKPQLKIESEMENSS